MKGSFAFVLFAALLACNGDDAGDAPPDDFSPPSTPDTVGVEARDLEAELPLLLASPIAHLGSPADAPAAGTVRVLRSSDADGALTVTIELNDVQPGRHAWEIRQGDCVASTDSTAASPASRTSGLTGAVDVGEAGFGEASAMLPLEAIEADDVGRSRYSLVVLGPQPAAGGSGGVIACAEL